MSYAALGRILCFFLFLTAPVQLFAQAAGPAGTAQKENVMLILDASGSMWGRVDGREKIVVAREVVGAVLADIGDKVTLGVMAYGHRAKGDCNDIETVVPAAPANAAQTMAVINALSPKGKTPISEAVRRAAGELRSTEAKATVILVSDGLETCEADPCALASELEKSGVDFTVHVVGFDLKGEDTRTLQCLAENTGGKYLSADNADELNSAIGEVVAEVAVAPPPPAAPEPEAKPTLLKVEVFYATGGEALENAYVSVFAADNEGGKAGAKAVTAGSKNNPFKVQPGSYFLETRVGKAFASGPVDVADGGTTQVALVLNAGLLKVAALAEEGGKPLDEAYIYVEEAEAGAGGNRGAVTSGNQRTQFVLPEGRYYARAVLGKASAGTEVEVKAGQLSETAVIIGLGVLQVTGIPAEGAKPISSYVNIYEVEKQLDGTRKRVTAGNARNQFKLSAGQYFVEVIAEKAKAGQEVEVSAGKLTEVTVNLNAGALSVSSDKKTYLVVYKAEKNLDGTRDRIGGISAGKPLMMPAGKYVVVGTRDKKNAEAEVEVMPGKLAEVTVTVE